MFLLSITQKIGKLLVIFCLVGLGISLSFSKEGEKIPKKLKLDETRQSVENLIRVLDEVYETLELRNNKDIVVKIKEYLNISKIAVENVSNLLKEFEDITNICTSLDNYYQARSSLLNAMINLSTDVFMLNSDLYNYFDESQNKKSSDKLKTKINKTKRSAYSCLDSFAKVATVFEHG